MNKDEEDLKWESYRAWRAYQDELEKVQDEGMTLSLEAGPPEFESPWQPSTNAKFIYPKAIEKVTE